LVVLSAVDFDDQLPVCTEEIDDVSVDGYLSLEFQSSKSAVSQTKPQQPLGIRLIATQSPRETWVSFRLLNPLTPTLSPAGRGSAPSPAHGFGLYRADLDLPATGYRFGWKSWLGNAAAPLSGALMTMKAWSVVAWQALHPVVTRP
jgi:hypothetical protein